MYGREEVNVVKDVIRIVKIMQFGRYSLAGVQRPAAAVHPFLLRVTYANYTVEVARLLCPSPVTMLLTSNRPKRAGPPWTGPRFVVLRMSLLWRGPSCHRGDVARIEGTHWKGPQRFGARVRGRGG
jgi:hypothetical protein